MKIEGLISSVINNQDHEKETVEVIESNNSEWDGSLYNIEPVCADVSDHLNILNVYGLGPQWLVSKNILNYFLTMTCSDPAPETCQC